MKFIRYVPLLDEKGNHVTRIPVDGEWCQTDGCQGKAVIEAGEDQADDDIEYPIYVVEEYDPASEKSLADDLKQALAIIEKKLKHFDHDPDKCGLYFPSDCRFLAKHGKYVITSDFDGYVTGTWAS